MVNMVISTPAEHKHVNIIIKGMLASVSSTACSYTPTRLIILDYSVMILRLVVLLLLFSFTC